MNSTKPQKDHFPARRAIPRKLTLALLVGLLGCGAVGSASAAPAAAEQWAKGRILVMPRAGLPEQALAAIASTVGGHARKVGQSDLHIVDLPAGASETAAVQRLSQNPHIQFAELDRKVSAKFTANDPYFGSEWHLAKVNAPSAWDTTQGAGVTIAILDSGVDGSHPDLVPNLVAGYNFYDNNTNTADACGHGTAVAGTAAAVTNNGAGVAGVAGQAKIMPIRVAYFDTTYNECYAYYSTISNGLTWAADHGAKIANVSYGGVSASSSIISAAQYMQSKGGLVFVSAGNNGTQDTTTPTSSMIVVSATDPNDNLYSWSTYGSFVTLSAPGDVWTTSNGSGYQEWMGTSFSSPLTAAVGALVMAANPNLTGASVQNILQSTAVDLGAAGKDIYYGYGRVNAAAAVQAALASPVADTTAPTASITSPGAGSSVSGVVPVSVSAADNVGVTSVQLTVNGTAVATSTSAPFSFSWDSTGVANGSATLVAYAYDAAGNKGASSSVTVNVANATTMVAKDTTPPVVSIVNPVPGMVSGTVSVNTNASDNNGTAGISQWIYIDGALKAQGTGATLSYSWNTRKVTSGTHTIQAVAKDAAGNQSSTSVQVTH
ncbi:S8 family serine peptidase [Noviherbaspirillum pedocola]|uniref:S8 family serine peptidase n=1 Tax=Noviherbaspirillum pedocola TaxID=2801341 RepID=A0A934SUQ0_9BURK|nr:S8 family serine peptidase [Noviherbaspirillum pedocola]MBK4735919.1 S8 family serine peptidase [Noviherbaspirillum pedocola]